MSKLYLFFALFYLFSQSVIPLYADEVDDLPANEEDAPIAQRRFRVAPLDTPIERMREPGKVAHAQHALRGKTLLNYNVGIQDFSCFFYALQVQRQAFIEQVIRAIDTDEHMAQQICRYLRAPFYEEVDRQNFARNRNARALAHNENLVVSKEHAKAFLRPFAANGEFTSYNIALIYGLLNHKKVFIWSYLKRREVVDPGLNRRVLRRGVEYTEWVRRPIFRFIPRHELELQECNEGDSPDHIHIGYEPGHFQRLVPEDSANFAFEKAKSLLIERKARTLIAPYGFLTAHEEARLKERFLPKPPPQTPAPVAKVPSSTPLILVPDTNGALQRRGRFAVQRTAKPVIQRKARAIMPRTQLTRTARVAPPPARTRSSVGKTLAQARMNSLSARRVLTRRGPVAPLAQRLRPSLVQRRVATLPRRVLKAVGVRRPVSKLPVRAISRPKISRPLRQIPVRTKPVNIKRKPQS